MASCSAGALTSMVSNLVRNAIKYIGGAPVRRVKVACKVRPSSVLIEVEDTGPGLPVGIEATVFEPYVRGSSARDKPGLGLGLATVRRLAQGHGGRAGVTSRPGVGCTFWVELPRPLQAVVASAPPTEPRVQH
jgi:signal transduction histidine kinase